MVDGNGGVPPTEHYRNLDDMPGAAPPQDDGPPLTIVIQEDAEKSPENIGITLADGTLIVRLDGKKPRQPSGESAQTHGANLAEHIDVLELARICDELLNGIDSDLQSRLDWIDRRAAGIKHLALKIENPKS